MDAAEEHGVWLPRGQAAPRERGGGVGGVGGVSRAVLVCLELREKRHLLSAEVDHLQEVNVLLQGANAALARLLKGISSVLYKLIVVPRRRTVRRELFMR